MEERFVSDFDAVLPIGGEFGEESVHCSGEFPAFVELARVEARELEDEDTNLGLDGFAGAEESLFEQLCIQEVFVIFAGQVTEAREFGKFLDGDVIGDFEGEPKVFGDLVREAGEVFFVGEAVVSGIDADRFEDFGVFLEAMAFEPSFSDLTAVEVAIFGVQLANPAGVFPRGSAEIDLLFGEFSQNGS